MTTTTPIPTSIAAACAAHDRHRLDVLDALLDEVAPSAVRELLGAALDLCATLRTERDEREEAIGATFAKHRAEIDAATAQLAAARQVIDEERATVARQTARVAELEALAPSHPVYLPLPAQDRAEELIRSILIKRKSMMSGLGASLDDKLSDAWASEWINATRAALASLGAPATTPTAAPAEIAGALSALNARLSVNAPTLAAAVDAVIVEWDRERAMATPTAAPGLVAAVSVEDLACAWFNVHGGDVKPSDIDDRDRAHVRAVLARLDATTIAPVDPEAVARAYHASEALPDVPSWTEVSSFGRHYAIAAMRATLTAAGIPVTPEAGK